MASVSTAQYTSASAYTVTISGMTPGQKYHLFIEDLGTDGSSAGWYCRYSQTASSTSYTYNGSTSATYSQYDRRVRLYCTGTTATSHSVGTRYSTSQLPSSNVTGAWTGTIEAWGGGSSSSYPLKVQCGAGVSGFFYRVNTTGADGSGTYTSSSVDKDDVGQGGYIYLTQVNIDDSRYTYPVKATDGSSTFTVINASGAWSDHKVNAGSTSGRTVTLYATEKQTYSYNTIYFRADESSISYYTMSYENEYGETLISSRITSESNSTPLHVRAGTKATLGNLQYTDSNYKNFQFFEYTNSAFSGSWTAFAQGDSEVTSNGTRYIKLYGVWLPTYYYRVRANANGGAFSSYDDPYLTARRSNEGSSITFDLSILPTPVRVGYRFLGWSESQNSSTVFDGKFMATSGTSSDSPYIKDVWAIWEPISYQIDIRLGAGLSGASVYVDNGLAAAIVDNEYHTVTAYITSTIELRNLNVQKGYGKPYTLAYYSATTSDIPTRTVEYSTDTVSFDSLGIDLHVTLSARKQLALFYWDSESTDDLVITAGQPISNLTYARWNKLKEYVKALVEANGGTYNYAQVAKGDPITAEEFNEVRNMIASQAGATNPPVQVTKNVTIIKAHLFNGENSLKGALNRAITYFNES